MSYNNISIPVISIIPDDDVDIDMDNDNDHMNIDEVATDTEDIYFSSEKRKKKTKKHHIPKKDPYATDVEEMEGSDNDDIVPLAKHANPISLDDVLEQTDVPVVEETYKLDEKNKRGKPKLRSQASTTTHPQHLQTLEDEFNQGLTDVEDFDNSSADDEESEPDIPDTDLLNEILHDAGTVAIADNIKKFLRTAPSPMVSPVNDDISDDECEDDESRPRQSFAESSRLRPLSMSPQLSDLTDCELLQYDSNDDLKLIKKSRCNRTKKNSLRKNSAFAITDTEDMELSDSDQMKLRRMTVIGLTKSNTDVIPPSTSKGILPFILNELVNDEDVYSKLLEQKRPNFFKHNLNVTEHLDVGLTDTEEIEGDDRPEEESHTILDDSTTNFTGEFESYNGVVEEKVSSRKIQNLYRIEETCVARANRSDDEDTDEEEYESDMVNGEKCKKPEESSIDFNFTSKKKPRMQPKIQVLKTKAPSSTLTASNAIEDSVLTDVENLESSSSSDDDDDIDKEEIPMTIVEKDNNSTDSDSIEGDDSEENIDLDKIDEELDDSFIPICPRHLIKEKEKDDGTCDISVTLLQDEPHKLNILNTNNDALTDLEDFSGDDEVLRENYAYDENEMPEIELEEANVNQCDSIKIPEKDVEVETDVEEISIPRKATKHTASKHFLHVANKDDDVITDLEDFDLSDNETNGARKMTLAPTTRANLHEAKTDVEDFEDSDNNECRQVRDVAVTPDILRQMGGETICSKEGNGTFSMQEREKLNERSNSIGFIDEPPSPTHTDDEFITSADDDNYSRTETVTPLHVRQQLDEASSFRVLSSNVKKINLDADDEVMYLKGGGFTSDVFTDTEEMGVSDEEYFSASDKASDKISLRIDSHQKTQGRVSLEKQNGGMSVAWHRGSLSTKGTSKEWGPSEDLSAIGKKPGDGMDSEKDAAQQETSGHTQQPGEGATTSSTVRKEEASSADRPPHTTDESGQGGTPERVATDLHQLSSEMKDLLAEMEKHSKQ